ncbi:MAG: carboxylesterase family protein [bacterium]|nr:carboxylesterase family protein [bacterium]
MSSDLLRRGFALGLVVALFACGGQTPAADPDTAREVEQGAVIGSSMEEGAVHAWLGLPFAKPPVDRLRWRAPQSPEPWDGSREALESGQACTQLSVGSVFGGEDCLYLDVFAPARAPDEVPTGSDRLPVMFWIHGGGNSMGWGNQLPASPLARDNDVIVVTINYRLGILGWLSHPALRASAQTPEDASGNFGTLDMIKALEWVRDNIARFGGDPDRVTIFGESAGGINVYSLLLSPRAKGLFHAAISQSGVAMTSTRAQAERYTDQGASSLEAGLPGSSAELLVALLEQAGRSASRDESKALAASMSEAEAEAFLRGFSNQELLQPFVDAMGDQAMPIYITPTLFRDGYVMSDGEPLEIFATPGAYNAVPFIAGTNREENKLFFLMTSPHISRTFGFPTGIANERLYDVEGEYGALAWRAVGADEPVAAMSSVQPGAVWSYRFDWDEQPEILGADLSKMLGAAHAMELLFVFGLTDLGIANRLFYDDLPSAERLSEQMRSYWANFAHTFRPGRGQGGDLPEWAPWEPEAGGHKYLIFDSERDGGIEAGTDEVDRALVLRQASSEPRLHNDEERCRVFLNFVQWSSVLTPEQYLEVNDGACVAYPIEDRISFPSLSHAPAS